MILGQDTLTSKYTKLKVQNITGDRFVFSNYFATDYDHEQKNVYIQGLTTGLLFLCSIQTV
jgi:hypothetical protein